MKTEEASSLSRAIEESVRIHGVTPAAVWLDRHDPLPKGVRRCEALFRMIQGGRKFSVLDVGCGPGFAVDFLHARYGKDAVEYCGVDISAPLVEAARARLPATNFLHRDIVSDPLPALAYDYAVLNGVLTAKFTLTHEQMEVLASNLLAAAWRSTRTALSFNVMSPYVDWKRDDLFLWPIERALDFCVSNLSRHCNVIADYGLYEYSVQVFRSPRDHGPVPAGWQPT
jgi:SAM-dependent methyltransferase